MRLFKIDSNGKKIIKTYNYDIYRFQIFHFQKIMIKFQLFQYVILCVWYLLCSSVISVNSKILK